MITPRAGVLLFRVTAAVVFLQLLLGGLLTFDFISAAPHILIGFAVFILAIATMVLTLVKPSFRPVQAVSIALVILIVTQIILGFATLRSGSQAIALIHFVNAIAIFGIATSGTFMALSWDYTMGTRKARGTGEGNRGRKAVP